MEFHIVINLKWFRRISKPKKSTIIFGTEHVKLGLVKNCLNSIIRWLANVTILLFTRTFETWYFCFSRKEKGIEHDPFVFWNLRAMCFFVLFVLLQTDPTDNKKIEADQWRWQTLHEYSGQPPEAFYSQKNNSCTPCVPMFEFRSYGGAQWLQ